MLTKRYFELFFKIYELYLADGGLGHFKLILTLKWTFKLPRQKNFEQAKSEKIEAKPNHHKNV